VNVVDLFAGGGGASLGIEWALGVAPAVAINHDQPAITMHAANHRGTLHLCEDLLRVRPFRPRGRPIDLLWGSPDCADHSNAKGGKPRETGRRLLAWVMVEWAREVHPRVICLENVPEFVQWGPLDADGKRIMSRRGETFREFVAALRLAGYRVEWRVLNAADYGAPTSRRRLFLVARCDGEPIVWPEPTHGVDRLPWRPASGCIDWWIPMLSIFATRAEAKAWARLVDAPGIPNRPLAEATQRRIAAGMRRFVIEAARPFLVRYQGERRPGEGGLVHDLDDPLPVQTTENRFGLVVPYLATTSNGERKGQTPRIRDIQRPLGTVCASGSQGALVAAWLAKHNGSGDRWDRAIGSSLTEPVHTVTVTDTKALGTADLATEPAENAHRVAAFMTKYYGAGIGQRVDEPLPTITTLDRFGLVTVTLEGTPYVVTNIGMRMLQPRELARAQGFPDNYVLTGSKRDQVGRIGNSAPPHVVAAVVAAQFGREPAEVAA
jgi:DNA (cytosine-5)-methyltransferase 1